MSDYKSSYLGYHSNNQYDNFPPLMQDGRSLIASYQPESVLNTYLLESNNIKSNWEYRKYLIENSQKIVEFNKKESENDIGYYMRQADLSKTTSNTPFSYSSYVDESKPIGYETSDLKEIYLSREQLNARMVAPTITQEELMTYNKSLVKSQIK
jgi:hypothetical protein